MLRAVARAARAAACASPEGALRRYGAEPFDAARAAHELERARLALEEKKAAAALALEEKTLALEEKKLAQGRGAWEVLFGMQRETAQTLNLCLAGLVVVSSGVYLVSGQLHESKAALQTAASTASARRRG